jgi:hypothetical protein
MDGLRKSLAYAQAKATAASRPSMSMSPSVDRACQANHPHWFPHLFLAFEGAARQTGLCEIQNDPPVISPCERRPHLPIKKLRSQI